MCGGGGPTTPTSTATGSATADEYDSGDDAAPTVPVKDKGDVTQTTSTPQGEGTPTPNTGTDKDSSKGGDGGDPTAKPGQQGGAPPTPGDGVVTTTPAATDSGSSGGGGAMIGIIIAVVVLALCAAAGLWYATLYPHAAPAYNPPNAPSLCRGARSPLSARPTHVLLVLHLLMRVLAPTCPRLGVDGTAAHRKKR